MEPKYWLTPHWPPYEWRNTVTGETICDTLHDEWFYWLYLTERFKRLGEEIRAGDGIFIYETEGRSYLEGEEVRQGVSQQWRGRRLKMGEKGIVALVWAIGTLENNPERGVIKDPEDAKSWDFQYIVKTKRDKLPGKPVPLSTVCQCLGYKPGWAPQNQLMRLTEEQWDCILRAFRAR